MSDQTSHHGGRRPHFHRGRRGQERRGVERRTGPNAPDATNREHVDVEQIMRDIRARIALRHGIELSNQQVQELAARRLEALLEPRNVNPSLLEQLRKAAGNTEDLPETPALANYAFEDTTLYDTHRGILRFFRRLLNPILKLFFNPATIVDALHKQVEINEAAARREMDRERQQAEWNALHYELLQRMVTEVSRLSIDMQALSMRIESLSTKVDFNERRVRSMENPQTTRPQSRPAPEPVAVQSSAPSEGESANGESAGDAPRRRRRRRRGRRGSTGAPEGATAGSAAAANGDLDDNEAAEIETSDEDFVESVVEGQAPMTFEPPPSHAPLQPPSEHAAPADRIQPEPPRDEPRPTATPDPAGSGPSDR